MPNFVRNVHSSFKDTFTDKLAIAFLSLILVVCVNYLVFSMVLVGRESVQAITAVEFNPLVTRLPNQTVAPGTNDVVLAEVSLPDPSIDSNYKCGYRLDDPASGFDNECFRMVDADGNATVGAGVSDDGDVTFLDLDYVGHMYNRKSILVSIQDNVCADNFVNPQEVYIDGSDWANGGYEPVPDPFSATGDEDCVPGNGGKDIIIYDADGSGTLNHGGYVNVAVSPIYTTNAWVHSEDVKENMLAAGLDNSSGTYIPSYDYDFNMSDNTYIEDSGRCGGAVPGTYELTKESIWADYRDDGVFDPAEDKILFDYSNCLKNGACSQGGCSGTKVSNPANAYWLAYHVDDGSCGGQAGNGWQPTEAVWSDNPNAGTVGVFDGFDFSIYDPASCLTGGEAGSLLISKAAMTETMYLMDTNKMRKDEEVFTGVNWGGAFPGQWMGDAAGKWSHPCGAGKPNGECWYDIDANGYLDSNDSVVIDVNGNGAYDSSDIVLYGTPTPGPGALLDLATANSAYPKQDYADCDGTFSPVGPGVCAPLAGPGTALTALPINAGVCTDSLNSPSLIWVDSDADCNSATGSVVGIIRNQFATFLTPAANINAGGTWRFLDLPVGSGDGVYNFNNDYLLYSNAGPVSSTYSYWPFIYTDNNGDSMLDHASYETILADKGTISSGIAGANKIIDGNLMTGMLINDQFSELTLQVRGRNNAGVDYTNPRIFVDFWLLGATDGRCDATDIPLASLTYANEDWITGATSFGVISLRACLVVDIPTSARNGAIMQAAIPKLLDNNGNGLYDPGDKGYFVYSNDDGPTDRDMVIPTVIKVAGGNNTFPRGVDITPEQGTIGGEPSGTPAGEPIVLPAGVEIGDLIKSPSATTVYVVTSEGKRRPFSTEIVYQSWYDDPNWLLVKHITDEKIAQISLDDQNAVIRAGTWLIKSQTQSSVYAVEPNGVRRQIMSEEIAKDLYGTNWNNRIKDINDAFWGDYTEGPALSASAYPSGSLLQYAGTADIYYLEDSIKRLVTPAVFTANTFQDKFVIKNVDAGKFDYQTGAPLAEFLDVQMALESNPVMRWFNPLAFKAFNPSLFLKK